MKRYKAFLNEKAKAKKQTEGGSIGDTVRTGFKNFVDAGGIQAVAGGTAASGLGKLAGAIKTYSNAPKPEPMPPPAPKPIEPYTVKRTGSMSSDITGTGGETKGSIFSHPSVSDPSKLQLRHIELDKPPDRVGTGAGSLRAAMRQWRDQNPGTKTIEYDRTTGARPGFRRMDASRLE